MKKRLLALLSAACLLLSVLPAAASAASSGDWDYEILDDGTAEITGYRGEAAELSVPSAFGSHSVSAIAYAAFASGTQLKSVGLPESLTSIGEAAFYDCTALKAVYFSGAAPQVGALAFSMRSGEAGRSAAIPGLTLYYLAGRDGWTSPRWQGYATALWDGVFPPRQAGADDFADVKPSDWYYAAVDFAVKRGLFNGTSATTFAPNTPMNRAMLVTVLWRCEGQPEPVGAASFADVPANEWYTEAVAWAAENGIVNGVGSGRFDPMGEITREQMAAILYRYCAQKGLQTDKRGELSAFPDAGQISAYAAEALSWAVAEGLIGGTVQNGQTYLDPGGSATRAQVATIFLRFLTSVA